MTEEEQLIAIAEACGWREAFPKAQKPHPETKRGGILLPYFWVNELTHERAMEVPDYFNDLNAMHEAEKQFLSGPNSYWINLLEITDRTGRTMDWRHFGNATAGQRAEAFLRTIGKWKDSSKKD